MSPREYHIVVLGVGGVGKSCVTAQFVRNVWIENYDPTIEDSYRKLVNVDGWQIVLEILDTAGTEQFTAMREMYIKTGQGFLLVYSLTSPASLKELEIIHDQIVRLKKDVQVPMVLVGNKSDLELERKVPFTQAYETCKRWGNIPFYETSARRRANIDEVFRDLCRQILHRDVNIAAELAAPGLPLAPAVTNNGPANMRSTTSTIFRVSTHHKNSSSKDNFTGSPPGLPNQVALACHTLTGSVPAFPTPAIPRYPESRDELNTKTAFNGRIGNLWGLRKFKPFTFSSWMSRRVSDKGQVYVARPPRTTINGESPLENHQTQSISNKSSRPSLFRNSKITSHLRSTSPRRSQVCFCGIRYLGATIKDTTTLTETREVSKTSEPSTLPTSQSNSTSNIISYNIMNPPPNTITTPLPAGASSAVPKDPCSEDSSSTSCHTSVTLASSSSSLPSPVLHPAKVLSPHSGSSDSTLHDSLSSSIHTACSDSVSTSFSPPSSASSSSSTSLWRRKISHPKKSLDRPSPLPPPIAPWHPDIR